MTIEQDKFEKYIKKTLERDLRYHLLHIWEKNA